MIKYDITTDLSKLSNLGFIHFAFIGRPHGLKGAFFLKTEDRRKTWDGYKSLLLETPQGYIEKKVMRHYLSGDALAIELEGFNRTEIESLYNKKLFVHKKEISIQKDEYLVNDLLDFKIVSNVDSECSDSSEQVLIGKIIGVISYGAQENLEIELNESFIKQFSAKNPTVLYPFIEKYILEIDYNNKQIKIEYLEDFLLG